MDRQLFWLNTFMCYAEQCYIQIPVSYMKKPIHKISNPFISCHTSHRIKSKDTDDGGSDVCLYNKNIYLS